MPEKVPTRAPPIRWPSTSGGSVIDPMVWITPSTAATMPSAGMASPMVVTAAATAWDSTVAQSISGDKSGSLRMVGVLTSAQSPDDIDDVLAVTLTTRSGLAYTQNVEVYRRSERTVKGDDGAEETQIVIEAVIEDAASGGILNS